MWASPCEKSAYHISVHRIWRRLRRSCASVPSRQSSLFAHAIYRATGRWISGPTEWLLVMHTLEGLSSNRTKLRSLFSWHGSCITWRRTCSGRVMGHSLPERNKTRTNEKSPTREKQNSYEREESYPRDTKLVRTRRVLPERNKTRTNEKSPTREKQN